MQKMKTGNDDWMYLDVKEQDLSPYRELIHKHNVTSPMMYRENLVQHFLSDPNKRGHTLPWDNMDGVRIRDGETSLWAGANFHGKSALLTQCMTQFLREDRQKLLLISPEFSPELNLSRIIQQVIAKPPGKITEADVTAVLAWLEGRLLIYDALGQCEIDDLCAVMYFAQENYGTTQVILDNLTIIKLPGGDVNTSQGSLMASFVQTARQTGMHIHLVCHTRKPQPGEEIGRYSIRGSSMLSDLTDNVFIVVRNENKEKKLGDLSLSDEERKEVRMQADTKLVCAKQRHGSAWVGTGKLYYSPLSMRWYENRQFIDRPFNEVVQLAELGGAITAGTV